MNNYKKTLVTTLVILMLTAMIMPVMASDVNVTSVVDTSTPFGSVTLAPGDSGSITINMGVTGKQTNSATFDVYKTWTLSGGVFTGSNPETFTVPARPVANAPATTFSISGTVIVDSSQVAGTFTLTVSAFNIQTTPTAALAVGSSSSYVITVTAPPPPPADTADPVTTITTNPITVPTWYNHDVIVTLSATDAGGSGVQEIDYTLNGVSSIVSGNTVTFTVSTEGANTLYYHAVDVAGNSEDEHGPVAINIDKTAPSITGAVTTSPNANDWYKADVTVHFTTSDALSGLAGTTPDQTLTLEGAAQSVTGIATDLAGNSASYTVSGINIDKTAPTIAASASPGPNANGWNNGDVVVTFTASDALSGLTETFPQSTTLTGEGAGQSASKTATDLAGNTASAGVTGINIDKTAPTLDVEVLATAYIGQTVTGTWTASDALSGINGPESGSFAVDTSSIGTKTDTITVYDEAGNPTSVTWSCQVIYKFGGFLQPINTDGHMSGFKKGSTIPVKFQLTDYDGNYISNAVARLTIQKMANGIPSGVEMEAASTSAATIGNLFRYDTTGNLYIFNLSTKTLDSSAIYRLTATLDDGISYTVDIAIK